MRCAMNKQKGRRLTMEVGKPAHEFDYDCVARSGGSLSRATM